MQKLSLKEIKTKMFKKWTFPAGASIYGIPRGGWMIAQLAETLGFGTQVDDPNCATIFVDDIIDSGATKEKWLNQFPGTAFWSPYDKTKEPGLPWLVFPWEGEANSDAEDIVRRQLQFIGEDPTRPGLLETPKRVVKSWKELFAGYEMKAAEILSKVFPSDSDEMVICRDIEFYSTCEHHLIPFFGTASIGYIPKGKVVGLSKLARVVEVFARRLQLQEQLTHQIAGAIQEQVPGILGVGVVMKAKHLCMCGRGISKQGSSMVTSAMLGKFRNDPAVRSEFLRLID